MPKVHFRQVEASQGQTFLTGLTLPSRTSQKGWLPGPIETLADDAAAWILDQISLRHAGVVIPFGAHGRFQSRQDLRMHVEFLSAAVDVEAPVYFTDYVVWLAGVLKARGVPVQMLIESLTLLRQFLAERLAPERRIAALACLDAGLTALAGDWQALVPFYQARLPEPHPAVGAFARCLLAGDSAAARAILDASTDVGGNPRRYVHIATHLFQPSLYAIGQTWERNEISVAQEHLASAVAQTLLVELFLKGPFQPPTGRMVLLAGVQHNHHVIGLRMLADAYELAGYAVQYLGANTPTEALLAQVDHAHPDLVALSVSMVQQFPTLRHCIATLRAELGGRCPVILVGGLPTNRFEGVWRYLGADAWSPDAEAAVAMTA